MLWEPQTRRKPDFISCYGVLHGLANLMRVESYLEVGVREGASVCCVAVNEVEVVNFAVMCLSKGKTYLDAAILKRIGDCFTTRNTDLELHLFDDWSYLGCEGGHDRVERLLRDVLGLKNYHIYDGDSHETLPKFKGTVDLAFVDGDHTAEGARRDLEDVVDHAKVVVFHDLFHPDWNGLEDVFVDFCRSRGLPYLIVGRRLLGTGIAFNVW